MTGEKCSCLRGSGLTKILGLAARERLPSIMWISISLSAKSFRLWANQGSGKTTLAKMLLGLINPTEGEVYFPGAEARYQDSKEKAGILEKHPGNLPRPILFLQHINKIDSLLLDCISLRGGKHLPRAKKLELMAEACSFVNLKFEELTNKYPFELSGGQQQRLMIARIFLLKPKVLLADEPTSMIDACSRATILDYLMKLRDETGMTLIFITHDIGLAYYVSDSVYIMEHGKFVESGSADEVIPAAEGGLYPTPDQRCSKDL